MIKLFRFLPTHWWRPSAWKTWAGYVRWRLETYGVYHPAGQFNWKAFGMLVRQTPSYLHWISDLDRLAKKEQAH